MINVQHEHDAAQGWLIGKASDVAKAGLTASDFSAFSYASKIDGELMFALEEDCDAYKFHKASKAKGIEWNIRDTQSDWSDVRSWPSIEREQPSIIDQLLQEQEQLTVKEFYEINGAL